MADKNKDHPPTTEIATKNVATDELADPLAAGAFDFDEFKRFIGDGFASIETVLLGDKELGKLPFYVGRLLGPSDPVEVGEEQLDGKTGEVTRNTMPTWVFNPATKLKSGAIGIAENVTHVIPSPYQVDAACRRIWQRAEQTNTVATVGIAYAGKIPIAGGRRQLGVYKAFSKFEPKPVAALSSVPKASG